MVNAERDIRSSPIVKLITNGRIIVIVADFVRHCWEYWSFDLFHCVLLGEMLSSGELKRSVVVR